MANTYYDSQLTAAEIEAVLEAIKGILNPANNGKVLAINNGKLEARSVQWGGGSAVVQPLSVTQNGTYNPPSGVDGYAPVTVDVSGGAEHYIYNKVESKPIIDTGIPCNTSGLKVSISVEFGGQNDRAVFGGAWATNGFFLSFYNNGLRFHSKGNYIDIPSSEVFVLFAGKNTIECTADSIVVNGHTHSISGASAHTSTTLKIFTPDSSHTAETQAIYSMKIYQGETLLRDFVPASDNGIACFLDNVSGNYFYNTGEANSLFYI